MFWNGLDAFSFLIRVFQLLFSCGLRLRSWMIRGLRKMFGFSWVFCLNFCIKWHQMTIFFLKWNFEMTQLRIHSSCWFTRPHETNASRVSDHEILERSIWEWILGDIFSVCTDGLLWNGAFSRLFNRLWRSTEVKWWNHQHQSFWLTRSWQALVGITPICAWTLPKLTELLRFERQHNLIPYYDCHNHNGCHEKSVWSRFRWNETDVSCGLYVSEALHHSLANGSTCSLVW